MAPEQWAGKKQDVRTDIYAFGIVMYEMCYGRLPFIAPNMRALAQQHCGVQPEIPDGHFADIIKMCLSKAPAARYAGPAELLNELKLICKREGFLLPTRPLPSGTRARDLRALAHGLGSLGQIQEALEAAQELVGLEPDEAENWTQCARLQLLSGNSDKALIAINRSLALDASRSEAWNNLGVILTRREEWQQPDGRLCGLQTDRT